MSESDRHAPLRGPRERVGRCHRAEVLGFSPQAFYKWLKRPCSDRDWADAHAINAIVDVHADDPEFGYRLISDELEQLGARTCERRVWRLCRQQRVWSITTKKGRAGKTPGPPRRPVRPSTTI